jgi:diaminopimelate decarboxylase
VIVESAGIVTSHVIYTKESGSKRFLIQDPAMNDLIRSALHKLFHPVCTMELGNYLVSPLPDSEPARLALKPWDVVDPIRKGGGFLAKHCLLPQLDRGLLLATFSAGAHGMTTALKYNTQPSPADEFINAQGTYLA